MKKSRLRLVFLAFVLLHVFLWDIERGHICHDPCCQGYVPQGIDQSRGTHIEDDQHLEYLPSSRDFQLKEASLQELGSNCSHRLLCSGQLLPLLLLFCGFGKLEQGVKLPKPPCAIVWELFLNAAARPPPSPPSPPSDR